MNLMTWIFDGVLGTTLVILAFRLLATPALFKAVVLYIAFGLLMALAWIRLRAPDIALAEAAIGAGLAGALFLTVLRRMGVDTASDPDESQETHGG